MPTAYVISISLEFFTTVTEAEVSKHLTRTYECSERRFQFRSYSAARWAYLAMEGIRIQHVTSQNYLFIYAFMAYNNADSYSESMSRRVVLLRHNKLRWAWNVAVMP